MFLIGFTDDGAKEVTREGSTTPLGLIRKYSSEITSSTQYSPS